jgi:hypothetical protein
MAYGGKTRAPAVRQYRQRGRSPREVKHPLPPELIVAEFAGELPPEVAAAVRNHVATCVACGDRAKALAAPYELLGSLGEAPVTYVPDLRRRVREKTMRTPLHMRLRRGAGTLGRGGLVTVTVLGAVVLIASLILIADVLRLPALGDRTSNQVSDVPPAGSGGVLLAQTGSVVSVSGDDGHTWYLPEVLGISESSGHVVRDMPADSGTFRPAAASQLPVAAELSHDGRTLYVLATDGHGQVALASLNAFSGSVLFVVPVAVPDAPVGADDTHPISLALAPDGSQVYIGLAMGPNGVAGPRVVVASARDGRMVRSITASLPDSVTEPPQSSGLPGVGSTTTPVTLSTVGLRASLAAGGTLLVSPDGQYLLDGVLLADANGPQALVCRRISLATGETQSALALPGDYRLGAMAASPDAARPYLFVTRVGPDGQTNILNVSALSLAQTALVPLGGPANLAGQSLHGSVSMSLSADGSRVYISDDYAPESYQLGGHDTWLLDATTGSVIAHHFAFNEAGQALANRHGGADGKAFVLLSGQIEVVAADLSGPNGPALWFQLSGGESIVRLIGTTP